MHVYTTTQVRKNIYQLVDEIALSSEPIYIVGKRNKAVMISEEDFRAMQETLHLASIPGMVSSILKSAQEPLDRCQMSLNW